MRVSRETDIPLPAMTPIADVGTAYNGNIKTRKTVKRVQRDVSCRRENFGPMFVVLVADC